jgi:hypothetical protein
MSYQYLYCPSCATRRAAHDYRCSVCNGPMRRSVISTNSLAQTTRRDPFTWQAIVPVEAKPAERQPVAA